MKWVISIFIIATLASCGTHHSIQTPTEMPKATASARVDVENTDRGINKAIVGTEKLKNSAENSKNTVSNQEVSIDAAIAAANRLQEQLEANKELQKIEVASLIGKLEEVKQQNSTLGLENSRLWSELLNHQEMLEGVRESNRAARAKVEDGDREKAILRKVLQKEVSDRELAVKERNKLASENTKLKEDKARNGVYRNWIIGIAWGYLSLLVLKNVAASAWPQAGVTKLLGRL